MKRCTNTFFIYCTYRNMSKEEKITDLFSFIRYANICAKIKQSVAEGLQEEYGITMRICKHVSRDLPETPRLLRERARGLSTYHSSGAGRLISRSACFPAGIDVVGQLVKRSG